MGITRKGAMHAKTTISPKPSLPGKSYGVKANSTKGLKSMSSNVPSNLTAPKWRK